MQLLKSNPTDTPRLHAIWNDAVRATHHFLSAKDFDFISELVQDYLKGQDFWILQNESQTIAFMGLTDHKIDSLFVDPKHHGKGCGQKLLQHAKSLWPELEVDVNEQNDLAFRFYCKNGFQQISRSEKDGLGLPYPILHMKFQNRKLS